jgi:hypothetical protein
MAHDARTTHRWLRIPVLLFMGTLVFYLFTANLWALQAHQAPRWTRHIPGYTWFGGWKMFTGRDPGHSMMVAQARVGEEWQRVPLRKLFPTHWESGPRYARSWYRKSPRAMRTLAQATCGRFVSEDGAKPEQVRFYVVRWPKKLGDKRQRPTKRAWRKKKKLIDWDCDRTHWLPQGRRI